MFRTPRCTVYAGAGQGSSSISGHPHRYHTPARNWTGSRIYAGPSPPFPLSELGPREINLATRTTPTKLNPPTTSPPPTDPVLESRALQSSFEPVQGHAHSFERVLLAAIEASTPTQPFPPIHAHRSIACVVASRQRPCSSRRTTGRPRGPRSRRRGRYGCSSPGRASCWPWR